MTTLTAQGPTADGSTQLRLKIGGLVLGIIVTAQLLATLHG